MSCLPRGFRFSQSALSDEARCRRRFWLRYVRRLDWPAAAAAATAWEEAARRGSQFHHWVEQEALGLDVGAEVEACGDARLQEWWRAWGAVPPPGASEGRVYSEVELAVPFAAFRLVAKFDRVVVGPDGIFRVFDWKTGAAAPAALESSWQTAVYLYVMAEAGGILEDGQRPGPERVSLTYWRTASPKEPLEIAYDAKGHAAVRARLETAVENIADRRGVDDFPLTDDINECRRCPFRVYCCRGGASDDSWDFTDEDLDWLESAWNEVEEDGRVD